MARRRRSSKPAKAGATSQFVRSSCSKGQKYPEHFSDRLKLAALGSRAAHLKLVRVALPTQLGASLSLQTPKSVFPVVSVVHEAHHCGDGPMAGSLSYEVVHLLADVAVLGMALGRGTQLQHVHRLAGVHLDAVAHPVRQRDGVGGDGRS